MTMTYGTCEHRDPVVAWRHYIGKRLFMETEKHSPSKEKQRDDRSTDQHSRCAGNLHWPEK